MMADMRLVDANALLRRIVAEENEIITDNAHAIGLHNGLTLAQAMVINATTIDAVPVVRCKDCRYVTAEDGEFYCDGPIGIFGTVGFNDFCSFGERKDDGICKED